MSRRKSRKDAARAARMAQHDGRLLFLFLDEHRGHPVSLEDLAGELRRRRRLARVTSERLFAAIRQVKGLGFVLVEHLRPDARDRVLLADQDPIALRAPDRTRDGITLPDASHAAANDASLELGATRAPDERSARAPLGPRSVAGVELWTCADDCGRVHATLEGAKRHAAERGSVPVELHPDRGVLRG